ncbi:hypothetical protein FA13DRAFT_1825117, partial [Coprinellus micaceus]
MIDVTDPAAVKARDKADQWHVLLSFWLGGIIYGFYIILFILSVRITMRTKRSQWTFSAMIFFVATFVMLVLTTIYMDAPISLRLQSGLDGGLRWTAPNILPTEDLVTTWDSYTNVVIMNILTWLADALVILPLLHRMGAKLLGYRPLIIDFITQFQCLNCSLFARVVPTPNSPGIQPSSSLLNMVYPINITQSLLTTGLITFKIWRQYILSRSAGLYAGGSGTGLLTIIRIIVESAMIFALQQLLLCVLYYVDSPAQYIFHGTMVPSIGVVFVLLAIRAYS